MSETNMNRCTTCKKLQNKCNFGYKSNGCEYKTCMLCRSKCAARISRKNNCLISHYQPDKIIHDKDKPFLKGTLSTYEPFLFRTEFADPKFDLIPVLKKLLFLPFTIFRWGTQNKDFFFLGREGGGRRQEIINKV